MCRLDYFHFSRKLNLKWHQQYIIFWFPQSKTLGVQRWPGKGCVELRLLSVTLVDQRLSRPFVALILKGSAGWPCFSEECQSLQEIFSKGKEAFSSPSEAFSKSCLVFHWLKGFLSKPWDWSLINWLVFLPPWRENSSKGNGIILIRLGQKLVKLPGRQTTPGALKSAYSWTTTQTSEIRISVGW